MRSKFMTTFLAMGIGLACVGLLVGLVARQAMAMPANYWMQVGGNGLGDSGNYQIPSLVVFGDYIYAGTWNTNWVTRTAQIWRSTTGISWNKVDDRVVDGAAAMIVFSNTLFAGSWDGFIWSSPDGLSWTEQITDGFGTQDQGIARFMLYGGDLYASTWNGDTGTEVWRSGNGKDWEQFIDAGLENNLNNASVISSEVFNGYLFMGVVNDSTGAQLWRTNGITTTAVITDGFGDPGNTAISALALFQDMLYASTYNEGGVQVWRSGNGTNWQKIDFGFGNPGTSQENALEAFHGQLYLAVANYTSGMQFWRTSNGMQWYQEARNGFGDASNHNPYWDNGMVGFKDKLYTGVTNWQNGGEIWQMTPGGYKTFLPITVKPCPPIFFEDFSNPASGWPVGDYAGAKYAYLNGEYQILTKIPHEIHGAIGDMGVSHFIAELDARPASHLDGGAGLIFNWVAPGQFYLFEISDGRYRLWRQDPSQRVTLVDWTQSPAINPGYASNHLKVVRNGDSIKIYANYQLLKTVDDSTYFGTWVGMSSQAFGTPNYDGRFDNLAIYTISGCGGTNLTSSSRSRVWLDHGVSSPEQ